MTADFAKLASQWATWNRVAGISNPRVEVPPDGDSVVEFDSPESSFHLRQEGGWWVVDEVDDRGRTYSSTARFSAFDLAEKYLVWTWASIARTAVGAPQLGRRFQRLGFNDNVRQSPTDQANLLELTTSEGSAILPNSKSTIFSHVLSLTLTQIEQLIRDDL